MRGHASIYIRSAKPRAYDGTARGEKTKLDPTPLERLGRESDRGEVKKIHREDANDQTGLLAPCSCFRAAPMGSYTSRIASKQTTNGGQHIGDLRHRGAYQRNPELST